MTVNSIKPPIAEIGADLISSSPYILVQSPPIKNNYLLELPDGNESISFLLDSREQQQGEGAVLNNRNKVVAPVKQVAATASWKDKD